MAVVEKNIKATGGHYANIDAWVAASYGATGADSAIGYLFRETYAHGTINDTTPMAIQLRAAVGEETDGTEGTGPIIQPTGFNRGIVITNTVPVTLGPYIEIDSQAAVRGGVQIATSNPSGGSHVVTRCLIYDASGTRHGISSTVGPVIVDNCIVYDIAGAPGVQLDGSVVFSVYNTTVKSCGTYGIGGFYAGATSTVKNCACFDNTTADYGANIDTFTTSASSDATGTAGLQSLVATNQFVDANGTPRNLLLKTGAGLIDAGTDLTTTANVSIRGRDRDAEGDTWDCGADEFVAAGGPDIASLMSTIGHQNHFPKAPPLEAIPY